MERRRILSDTADRVRKIIEEHIGVDPSKITDDAMLTDDLGADSLDAIELVMACEDQFGITISDDLADKCFADGRVKTLIALVDSLRSGSASAA